MVGEYMRSQGVTVITGTRMTALEDTAGGVRVIGDPDWRMTTDLVLIVAGVKPDTELAHQAGIETGLRGAIRVDRQMKTNRADIWAAGDYVATYHRLLERSTYIPSGTTVHKQGRVASENVAGNTVYLTERWAPKWSRFSTGLSIAPGSRQVRSSSRDFHPDYLTNWDHNVYYPGVTPPSDVCHPVYFKRVFG